MAKKQQAPKAKEVTEEKCPKCLSNKFSVETSGHHKRYCQTCSHVWMPLSKDALELQGMKEDYAKLEAANFRLKEENEVIKDVLKQAREYVEHHEKNLSGHINSELCVALREVLGEKSHVIEDKEGSIFG